MRPHTPHGAGLLGHRIETASVGPVVVTGANGYIGRQVVALARSMGIEVRMLVRRPPQGGEDQAGFHPYRLGDTPPASVLAGASAVIHLALDATGGVEINLEGSRRLLDAARRHGVGRFIFVSSQSSAPTAISDYGRGKWEIEKLLDRPGEIAVRPGMVYGGPESGLYGLMCRLVAKLPVIPMIRPDAPLYPIHVDDLAQALLLLALGPMPKSRLYCLGTPQAIDMRTFMTRLGEVRVGRRPRLLICPHEPILAALKVAATVSPKGYYLRERVLGLLALLEMDTVLGLRDAGIELRPFAFQAGGGTSSFNRRRILEEGLSFLRYCFGPTASRFAIRRWVRLLPPEAAALPLPRWGRRLLRVCEPVAVLPMNERAKDFQKRLHLALLAGEAAGPGAVHLAHSRRTGPFAVLTDLIMASISETLVLPIRLAVHLAWWRK